MVTELEVDTGLLAQLKILVKNRPELNLNSVEKGVDVAINEFLARNTVDVLEELQETIFL